jgi:hypothetical protein
MYETTELGQSTEQRKTHVAGSKSSSELMRGNHSEYIVPSVGLCLVTGCRHPVLARQAASYLDLVTPKLNWIEAASQ